ncbi:AAA family ATPase [Methylorubrum salsuginis]|uniref:ATP-binding protein n=1 Tax=Methylorubrum salsuginis TaxID=414703 RepID=UPI000B88E630
MRPGPLVVLLGISGVGKSFLVQKISERRSDLLCISAGTLLRDALKADPEQLRTSNRNVILSNQLLLADAVRRARSGRLQQTVLLEAHSIIDNDTELIEVPLEVIRALEIAGIILVEDHVTHIKRKRKTDTRFRPDRCLRELKDQQQQSSDAATRYSIALNVPIQKVLSGDVENTLDFICRLEKSSRLEQSDSQSRS